MADLPVLPFIQERLKEADTTLETRAGTAFFDLFVKPQQFMLQPLITSMETVLIAQSVNRILSLPNPNLFDTGLVDDLVSNVYVSRFTGNLATSIIRVLYQTPVDREYAALTAEFDSSSLSFFNSEDVVITAAQMKLQVTGNFYYLDFAVQAQFTGEAYNLDTSQGVTFVNDLAAVNAYFLAPAEGGLSTETNSEVLSRAKVSIGVRDLETVKGINAIIQENFTYVSEIQAIGMGDPEMQRDILFNTHVGGKTDIYLKTPSFQTKTANFIGVEFDFTRNLSHNTHLQMTASSFADPAANLNTPYIVSSTLSVLSDTIPTAAQFISTSFAGSSNVVRYITCSTLASSTTVTGNTANILVGFTVTGAGIPAGTVVSNILNTTSFTISNAAFLSATNILTFAGTVSGLNLGLGQWIKLQIDSAPAVNVKVAGANPTTTQRFEVINAINAAVGLTVASEYGTDQIRVLSPTTGVGSQIYLYQPDGTRTDGTLLLVPAAGAAGYAPPIPAEFLGNAPITYIENVDYMVDYSNWKIIRTPGSSILSGTTVAQYLPPAVFNTGAGHITTGSNLFTSATVGAFNNVRVGDIVTITSSTGVIPGTFVVSSKVSNQVLRLLGMVPTSSDALVQYGITSEQVVVVKYKYNPLSIDIGPNILLSDGVSRGVRLGRENFTIKDVAFVDIISIQEIDPITLEGLGTFLNGPGGFGTGGFGEGSFGSGNAGDYNFIVNSPTERLSAFEDSLITFSPSLFGQSFQITYYAATEVAGIHTFCRTDGERVTGADVLPKCFVPGLVDMSITVRPSATSASTPTNAALVTLVSDYVNTLPVGAPVEESVIEQLIINQGIASVQTPFVMTATVLNPDGSTTILTSEDELAFPDVTLESQTDNFTTSRIVHWYPRYITITGVS